MLDQKDESPASNRPPIYVVSGSVGASGEQLVQTVLAQFPNAQVQVITVGHVRQRDQIEHVVAQAKECNGTIVHTLVNTQLRYALIDLARKENVVAIDLMGDLLTRLAEVLEQPPLEEPGLYRRYHRAYFERLSAIEFMMAHDDGQRPQDWQLAEIVLVGASRMGKTPLSVYLSVLGWKVANVPLVPELPTPAGLTQLDQRRVIGLTMDADQLTMFREQRQRLLGARAPSGYAEPENIQEEIQAALRVFRRNRFTIVDVTDKPIESSADEIIKIITRQVGTERKNAQ